MDLRHKKILVTGGNGFLGKYVVKKLKQIGVQNDSTIIPRSKEYDLRKEKDCRTVLKGVNIVIHLAARVGGIGFNLKNPGSLFYDNLIMGAYLMELARKSKVEKFVGIGTVCAYPKLTPIPFKEEDLWNGYPEETNAPYGLAKKMLLVQGHAYRKQYGFNAIYLLPVNLYGPGDKFDLENSHVIPALIRKFFEGKQKNLPQVIVWGTGKPTREFLYVKDAAEAIVLATQQYNKPEPINIGSSFEISIKHLAETIAKLVGYKGEIIFDATKPDGQPRRKLDIAKAEKEFGFKAKTDFKTGLQKTVAWYIKHLNI